MVGGEVDGPADGLRRLISTPRRARYELLMQQRDNLLEKRAELPAALPTMIQNKELSTLSAQVVVAAAAAAAGASAWRAR